ncbi:hypothetical protein V6U71_08635 [Sphingopyxis sp. J-6]|uniref:hypothetical protein n=1 Tax=Sphingopyxis sp. J-6 TaxID=3122054 RepID=UPI0039844E6D
MSLFRRVLNLVDKDVAANSKPISLAGMIIPFLPFMLFTDGPPIKNYPVLSGLALTTSVGWGLFVLWRLLRHLKGELRPHYEAYGAARIWSIMVGTIIFILLLVAGQIGFANKIGWPEAYGFDCHGRGCLLQDLYHSPSLLSGGSFYELALFAFLWAVPVIIVAAIAYALFKKHRAKKSQWKD